MFTYFFVPFSFLSSRTVFRSWFFLGGVTVVSLQFGNRAREMQFYLLLPSINLLVSFSFDRCRRSYKLSPALNVVLLPWRVLSLCEWAGVCVAKMDDVHG